jgi:hypothetical protein
MMTWSVFKLFGGESAILLQKESFLLSLRIFLLLQVMSRGVGSVEGGVGVSDMCLLEPLEEESFIDNLHKRFSADQIYVSLFFPCWIFSESIMLQMSLNLNSICCLVASLPCIASCSCILNESFYSFLDVHRKRCCVREPVQANAPLHSWSHFPVS